MLRAALGTKGECDGSPRRPDARSRLHTSPLADFTVFREPVTQRFAFASHVGIPPYLDTGMRMKGGLKRTAFAPFLERFASEYKLHNTFLKPDQFTDPLEEYWAMREAAGLWDVTGEEPVEIRGPEAAALVEELVPRDLRRLADGRCAFTVMCYDYGGIVEDAILIRFDSERFWWVGGPGASEQWIYGQSIGREVEVESHIDRIHVASIQGPCSREILQSVCAADLGRMPWFAMAETEVCGVPVVVSRTGFSAELGYDIYVAVDDGVAMFEGLWEAGRGSGMRLCGSRALNIRRMEAGILNVGQDFDWTCNPFEVGLEWMVDLDKPFFHGRRALARIAAEGPARRIAGFEIDHDRAVAHGSPVRCGGEAVGVVSSAVSSPALGSSIGMGLLRQGCAEPGTELVVEDPGGARAARVVPMPFLDPEKRLPRS